MEEIVVVKCETRAELDSALKEFYSNQDIEVINTSRCTTSNNDFTMSDLSRGVTNIRYIGRIHYRYK
jgi:hypothetical protein